MTIFEEKAILDKARTLQTSAGIKEFPLRLKPITDYLERECGIQFWRFSELAEEYGVPIETVGHMAGSDEAALVYCGQDKPIYIYYRDTGIPRVRIRWNLGHEIAHYVCGHHLIRFRALLAGLGLSKANEQRIEAEANTFIREMHAPLELVLLFMGNYKIYDRLGAFAVLRGIFQMSVPASYYYANRIFDRPVRELSNAENLRQYLDFYHEFTTTFDKAAFAAVQRRYEPEYDMFEKHLTRRALPDYRLPYQESISAIVSRVLPRNAEDSGLA